MKARVIWGFLFATSVIFLTSCGKDPVPNAGISFEVEAEETNESDGKLTSMHPEIQTGGLGTDIKIKVVLDRPLSDNAVITYSVGGTASKKNGTAGSGTSTYTTYSDFYLDGSNAKDKETLVIPKDATEAEIKITVFEDYDFEIDDEDSKGNYIETVVLTLESVVSGPIQLGTDKLTNTLTIKEDDAVFFLNWYALDSSTPTVQGGDATIKADLDMVAQTGGKVANASDATGSSYEAMFIPAGFPAGTYNMNYPYYSGTSDNVRVVVTMFNTAGMLNGKSYPFSGTAPGLTFTSTCKKVNINPYTTYASLATLQTMVKSGIDYTSISQIVYPATSSRTTEENIMNSGGKPTSLKLRNDQLQKILTRINK